MHERFFDALKICREKPPVDFAFPFVILSPNWFVIPHPMKDLRRLLGVEAPETMTAVDQEETMIVMAGEGSSMVEIEIPTAEIENPMVGIGMEETEVLIDRNTDAERQTSDWLSIVYCR